MRPSHYNKFLLLAGLFFTIHNIEEAVGTAHFVMPSDIKLPIALPLAESMIWSIILITVIGWGIILWTVWQRNEVSKKNVLTFLFFIFLINAAFPHITASLVLGMYTPALISSVIIYIPFSLWGLPKLYRQFDRKKQFYAVLYVGIVVSVIIVVALQRITSLIFS